MRIGDGSSDGCSSVLYKVGSVSKVFTALAIQVAARQGLVSLDQPLRQRLADPPWHNRWQATRPITLAMLLEHSAGWFDMGRAEFDSADRSEEHTSELQSLMRISYAVF